MIKFNPKSKYLTDAMGIVDQEEAAQFLADYVDHIQEKTEKSKEEALYIAKYNMGYFVGYCRAETIGRIQRLFGCCHPIFGRAK